LILAAVIFWSFSLFPSEPKNNILTRAIEHAPSEAARGATTEMHGDGARMYGNEAGNRSGRREVR
jgi:hypothetical protein